MASVFLYHVVGDLTVGKPDLVEFLETETVEAAIRAIGEGTECGITVWRRKPQKGMIESSEMRQQRFVGILNSLDIVAFLANDWCLENQEKAMNTPISEVVIPNNSLLKEVHPATRLIDALEIMKQGVKRLVIPTSVGWKCVSKKFSVLYNGTWLKNGSNPSLRNINMPSSSPSTSTNNSTRPTFCSLSREDVTRFLIGCLGALAPIPLSPISSLEAVNPHFSSLEASFSAIEAITRKMPQDPNAIAVVESISEGQHKIIGEISACKLWKCDYLAAAYALANLSAGQFVMGVEDTLGHQAATVIRVNAGAQGVGPTLDRVRNIYWWRSVPLTCKATSTLAAVMAQMLSHRATHVWVTEGEDDVLIGVVGYREILSAVTRPLPPPPTMS